MKFNVRLAIDADSVLLEDRQKTMKNLALLKELTLIDSVEEKPNGAIVVKISGNIGTGE